MNTKEYILEKDPDYYAFLEELLQKQEDYLAGNEEVLADNWSQTYLTLAERVSNDHTLAASLLDTALTYSKNYVPAILEYSQVHARQGNYEEARSFTQKAKDIDDTYAPIFVDEANIIHHQALNGDVDFDEALEDQNDLLNQAKTLEDDLAEAAQLNRLMRERFLDYGKIAMALEYSRGICCFSAYHFDLSYRS
ncbi:MAG: hypothetical protein U5K71_09405 [Gracilimonas sp.]|nr:hypothetical protein [Gracilimonas sp.]